MDAEALDQLFDFRHDVGGAADAVTLAHGDVAGAEGALEGAAPAGDHGGAAPADINITVGAVARQVHEVPGRKGESRRR